MHNSDDFNNKTSTVDKKMESNKEDILTPSVKENIQVIFTNENVFKIVVIMIACLNKLHQTGMFDYFKNSC